MDITWQFAYVFPRFFFTMNLYFSNDRKWTTSHLKYHIPTHSHPLINPPSLLIIFIHLFNFIVTFHPLFHLLWILKKKYVQLMLCYVFQSWEFLHLAMALQNLAYHLPKYFVRIWKKRSSNLATKLHLNIRGLYNMLQ